jgi:hypothetical protein
LKSLFQTDFNWPFFVGMCLVIRVIFFEMSWLSFFALIISLQQFILLFNSIGYVIPVRYLFGALMCVQFFIGPMLAYNGLDQYQYIHYRMKIPEASYFTYAIPAVVSFILGLHLNAGRLKGEVINEQDIFFFVKKYPKLPYFFIIIGFLSSIIAVFFSSELAFVFYLMGNVKFIGLFLLVLGSKELKLLPMMVVIGSIISTSLGEGMFHDLLTWIIFTGAVFAIRFKFDFNVKLIGSISFILIAVTIQVLKGSYRSATGSGVEAAGFETFTKLYEQQNENSSIFSFERLAPSNVRINQGFILTNIMNMVPAKTPFSNGEEMYQIFEAAIMPRILAPNKLNAGDRTIFTKYSGIKLTEGTSMGLSSLGDAYLNYGIVGGSFFMFLLGLMYSTILGIFQKQGRKYPVLLLFTALVFYFPIRPDCELQTILGHLFKSCFLIYVMIVFFKNSFKTVAPFQVSQI